MSFHIPWFLNQAIGLVHRGQESRCEPQLWDVAYSKVLLGQRPETSQGAPPEGDQMMLLTPTTHLTKVPLNTDTQAYLHFMIYVYYSKGSTH